MKNKDIKCSFDSNVEIEWKLLFEEALYLRQFSGETYSW